MPTLLEFPMQSEQQPLTAIRNIEVIYSQPTFTPTQRVSLNQQQDYQQKRNVPAVIQIGKRRRQILEALVECQDLSIDQLQRILRLSPASIPYLREHLRALTQGGYVEIGVPPKQTFYGRAPNIYAYGPQALKHLRKNRYAVARRYRSLKERLHAEYPIRHTLGVNEVLIDAKNLKYEVPGVRLKDSVHETFLNAKPLRIQLPMREKPYGLSPDLWLYFSHRFWDYFCCVELNLSKVDQDDWRERVRAYLYSLAAYRERFGTNALVILVIIQSKFDFPKTNTEVLTPEEVLELEEEWENRRLRLENFVSWTEAELRALNAQRHADMFWFTDIRLHDTTPKELFYGMHWRVPFRDTLCAPLPPGKGVDGG
jgi:DNA-binding transcriptional ArsR family regulator